MYISRSTGLLMSRISGLESYHHYAVIASLESLFCINLIMYKDTEAGHKQMTLSISPKAGWFAIRAHRLTRTNIAVSFQIQQIRIPRLIAWHQSSSLSPSPYRVVFAGESSHLHSSESRQ